MSHSRQKLGRSAEALAARWISDEGGVILERNARVEEVRGDIDLVAMERDTLAFIEVKALRQGNRAGPDRPELAVGPVKRLRVRRLARAWLAERGPRGAGGIRFDVVGVTVGADGSVAGVRWIRDAF